MPNLLDLVDQAFFGLEQSGGIGQCVWVYNRPVDIDGLRRFHDHLQRGRLGRRIERSPLPFGRYRWVTPRDRSELEIAAPRPREEFEAWLGEQANIPLDAERGPGWHLAVLPFTDGGAGVSFVVTHCLTDGIGGCLAIAEAAAGYDPSFIWPAAGSRPRWRALREDARQTVRDLPEIRRAAKSAVAAARLARRNRRSMPAVSGPAITGGDEIVALPTVTAFFDADEWDARAQLLGGTSNTLLVGLTARLAQRLGRVAADGSVTVAIPVNERTEAQDTCANAIGSVDIAVDPAPLTTDLRPLRAATKQALIRHREVPDGRLALLPLAPVLPQWLIKRMVGVALGNAATSGSSNLGAAPEVVNRPDGTDADYVALRSLYPRVTKAILHRTGGLLVLHSARVHQQVFVSVVAYQPGRYNSDAELWFDFSSVTGEFALTATTGWGRKKTMSVPAAQASWHQRVLEHLSSCELI